MRRLFVMSYETSVARPSPGALGSGRVLVLSADAMARVETVTPARPAETGAFTG